MNKVEAKIIGFELSDITLQDSYEWDEFISKKLLFREFNLGHLNERPLQSIETYIEYRIFESPNPFLQHLRFHSRVRYEFEIAQPWLDANDLFNLYETHALQTNDILQQMFERRQIVNLIQIPTNDDEVILLSNRIFDIHFKDHKDA